MPQAATCQTAALFAGVSFVITTTVKPRGCGSFAPDGRVEKTSEPHATYGKALVAALQNGFKPDQDDYSLDLPYGRMHFPPGRIPEFSPEPLPLPESASGTIDEPPAPESRSVPRVSQGKPPLDFTISPKAWALLEFLHRADQGGAPPPALDGFRKGYNELLVLKLARRTAERMEITDRGEEALRARHLRS